jgi:hypothetical protein
VLCAEAKKPRALRATPSAEAGLQCVVCDSGRSAAIECQCPRQIRLMKLDKDSKFTDTDGVLKYWLKVRFEGEACYWFCSVCKE